MKKRLIIVSNRLPLSIEKGDAGYYSRQSSGGLVSAVDAFLKGNSGQEFSERIWTGVAGCEEEVWENVVLTPSNYSYQPIFPGDDEYEKYYNGFANSLLWPLFHYFPSYADYDPAFFDAYYNVNQLFAKSLSKIIKEGDVVWIQDYHLLPLAKMLRDKFPALTIGLFLHIPFPSYELFRVIPKRWQKVLLEGMLGADLIGFHTSEYVSHFLKTVDSSLKAEHDSKYIQWQNRQIQVDAFPISIDFDLFDSAYQSPDVIELRNKYLDIKGTKKMLFSVDRLDYTKGIPNRLLGYEKFLQLNPAYIGQIVFVLVIVPSRDSIDKYNEKKKMIDEFIGNLNSTIGNLEWQPVIYQYGHLDFAELVALYTACDVALITPLRDGMNLVAKEFIASRRDERGVLILSEMAGAAAELTESLLINPNDNDEVADMIDTALSMPESEQQQRLVTMRKLVKEYDVNAWAVDFFGQLNELKSIQLKFEVKFLDNFGRQGLLNKYATAKKRLLLLDYDGTLVNFSKKPEDARPGAALKDILRRLSEAEHNLVYIVSGRDSNTLESWLGDLPIGIIAEHGAKVKTKGGAWANQVLADAISWKEKIEPIMARYVFRNPNSFIEQKDFSLAWHYRNADPHLADRRAKDLYDELVDYTLQMPLDVLNGHKVIEVRNKGINKGAAITALFNPDDFDFVLCIGDDQTDEDMFKVLATNRNAHTIKVGHQASFATYNLYTPFLVVALLDSIAAVDEKQNIV